MRPALCAALWAASPGPALADTETVLGLSTAEETLAVTAAEIAGADAGAAGLFVRLSDPAARRFAVLTRGAIGEAMTLSVCGQAVMSARVQAEIGSGAILVPMADGVAADRIARILRGEIGCDGGPPG